MLCFGFASASIITWETAASSRKCQQDAAERHARSPPTPAHVASTPLNHTEREERDERFLEEGGFHILLFQLPNPPMTDAVGSLRSSG